MTGPLDHLASRCSQDEGGSRSAASSDDDSLALAAKAQQGDRRALSGFFRRHDLRLRRMVGQRADRRVQRRMTVTDLVQNSLMEAADRFQDEDLGTRGRIRSWLERIARRVVDRERKLVRAQRRDPFNEVQLDAQVGEGPRHREIASGQPDAAAIAMNAERAAIVDEVLDSLHADHREVLVQRNFENRSWPEIASNLGRSVDAVKALHDRALKNFSAAIAPRLDE